MHVKIHRSPLVIATLFAVMFFGFAYRVDLKDAGMTFDDGVQRARGSGCLAFLLTGDRTGLPRDESQGDPVYGPFAVTIAAACQKLVVERRLLPAGAEDFQGFFAGVLLFAALGIGTTVWLGARLPGSVLCGVGAGLLVLALPRFWGMALNQPSDVPAAGLLALALGAWHGAQVSAGGARWRRLVLLALATGLLAAVRVQNAVFVPVIILGDVLLRRLLGERGAGAVLRGALAVIPLALLTWVVAWPDFWDAPIDKPLHVLRQIFVVRQKGTSGTMWFGAIATAPPLYPFVWLLLTTPTWLLALALVGVWRVLRVPGTGPGPLLVVWCAVSVGKHLTGYGNYGGLRHFFDALFPLGMLAALGAQFVLARVLPARLVPAGLLPLGVLAAVTGHAPAPFGDSWFSHTVGGLPAMVGRFDLDPNGSAILHGLRRFAPRIEEGAALIYIGNHAQLRQGGGAGHRLGDPQVLRDLLAVEQVRRELSATQLYYLHFCDVEPAGLGPLAPHVVKLDALVVDGVELLALYRVDRRLPFLLELRDRLTARMGR